MTLLIVMRWQRAIQNPNASLKRMYSLFMSMCVCVCAWDDIQVMDIIIENLSFSQSLSLSFPYNKPLT